MDARRVRILVGSIFSAGMVMSLFVAPVAAACGLSAPAAVDIGSPLTIEGSGFPASTAVAVAMTIEGGTPDEFTVQSDGTGGFAISLTPEASEAGVTTVTATSGADCTAQAVIAVGVAPAPVTPEVTEAGSDTGTGATAPRTDAITAGEANATGQSRLWLMAGALFLIGLVGLYATRPARSH